MKDSMMWPQFLLLFLTVGLAAGCDEDACNIGISVAVGIAKTCAAVGGVTCVFTGWSTLGLSCVAFAACKVAGVVDQVGKSACNLCGKDQSQEDFSAGQLRNLTEQVFESEQRLQHGIKETQDLIRKRSQAVLDGIKEVDQNIMRLAHQVEDVRIDLSKTIKKGALQTSYVDDFERFAQFSQRYEDLERGGSGLIVNNRDVEEFKQVVNDFILGAEQTYTNIHTMIVGNSLLGQESIFAIDRASCSSKGYLLFMLHRLFELDATAKFMDGQLVAPVQTERFKKMLINVEQKHIQTCGCPPGQTPQRVNNLPFLVSQPRPKTSAGEFYDQIIGDDTISRTDLKKLRLLYKAKPFDFSPRILTAIRTQPIEVPEMIYRLHSSDSLNTLLLLENKLFCAEGGEEGVLITGGFAPFGGSRLSSVGVFPSTSESECSPPPLPAGRDLHTTFLTSEPNPVIATCGGRLRGEDATASCLVLDESNQRWDESRMGDLTMPREYSAVATLNSVGVFIIGGDTDNNKRTSDFLAAGQMQWQEGPALPVDMTSPCVVTITPTTFLSIYGYNIREFDTAIAGPTSIDGWREAGRWPSLKKSRSEWPGCAKLGQKVIIAGGSYGGSLRSTEVLDLDSREITAGGDMATPRSYFHLATIRSGGQEKVFAVAGLDALGNKLNSVEEWVEESSTWKAATSLTSTRAYHGVTLVPKHLVC
jgi:hypothetical protein